MNARRGLVLSIVLLVCLFSFSTLVLAQTIDEDCGFWCNLWGKIVYLFTGKMTITGAVIFTPADCDANAPGMVSYWTFDDELNPAKDDYGGNDGTINGTNWTSSGKVGSALSFDGVDDYVNAGNIQTMSSNITMEVWVKPVDFISGMHGIVSKTNGGSSGYATIRTGSDDPEAKDLPVFILREVDGGEGVHAWGTTHLQIGEWYHLVGIYDGSHVKLYVNGVLEGDEENLAGMQFNDQDVNIGRESFNRYINAIIDEVAIYNRSLSADEIQEHYINSKYYDKGYCEEYEPADADSDGVPDDVDNCPTVYNPDQKNSEVVEIVDGFEDYNDSSNEIFNTWIDGYGNDTNGATVGYPNPDWNLDEHYVETTIVHGGNQSMPFFYDNTGDAAYSEGERTFVVPQNWTEAGVQTLALYFYGTAGNTGQLYVEVSGIKVVYDGDPLDIVQVQWNQWSIDLTSLGVDLQSVTTLAIGIDGNNASGTLYFDDIILSLGPGPDGVGDACDNCWYVANPFQIDTDGSCNALKNNSAYANQSLYGKPWIQNPKCGDACEAAEPAPGQITNCEELQAMADNLTADYYLANDISCDIAPYNIGEGFEPVGNETDKFTGTFDGQNHAITNLFINRTNSTYVGLFGYADSGAEIKNVGLENVDITGSRPVGGLVGRTNGGIISNSYASGIVTGTGDGVGGLVGGNLGVIINSYASVDVNGAWEAGGLVGWNSGTITNSYATGNVDGANNVGGLVGNSFGGIITNSYATGSVTGDYIGGLVGWNHEATITNSYATGNVNGGSYTGGLVGYNYQGGTITNCFYFNSSLGGEGTPIDDIDYFKGDVYPDNEPMVSWNFTCSGNIWNEVANDFPHLVWEGIGGAIGVAAFGSGTQADPYNISNCCELQTMKEDLTAYYILTRDIDCSATLTWNSGAGFEPVGWYIAHDNNAPFTGTFDGQNHAITNLFINRTNSTYVGLFGYADDRANIKNVGLVDVNIAGDNRVGGLVGVNYDGTITNCYVTGNVTGDDTLGGLVGENNAFGTITNCYATGNVIGLGSEVGGLVGFNVIGTITNSYSTGNVIGMWSDAGGLVGKNHQGTISNSYATGSVNGNYVGGLVGSSSGTITNSYATGDVNGSNHVGGLVGANEDGDITNSYSTGNVTGDSAGGLVGVHEEGTITTSYWNNKTGNPSHCWTNSTGNHNIGCEAIDDNESYFYVVENPPMNVWDFVSIWDYFCNNSGYPPLEWENVSDVSECLGYVDTIPPLIKIINPSPEESLVYSTTQTWINITTDEIAVCRYNRTNSTFGFGEGTNFANTNSLSHSFLLSVSAGSSYNLYYKCNDSVGNVNVNSTHHHFSVSSVPAPPSGGGGGGRAAIAKEYYLGALTETEVTQLMAVGESAIFSVKGVSHTTKVTTLTTSSVTLEISSDPITVTLALQETKKFDLNADGVYELSITLNSISASKANLAFKEISEPLAVCIENWTCTDWMPTECPENKTQIRVCIDKNRCGTFINKPAEQQSCIYALPIEEKPAPPEKPGYGWMITLIIVMVFVIAVMISLVLPKLKVEKKIKKKYPSITDEHIKSLKETVSKAKNLKWTREKIKQKLLSKGWPEEIVNKVLKMY